MVVEADEIIRLIDKIGAYLNFVRPGFTIGPGSTFIGYKLRVVEANRNGLRCSLRYFLIIGSVKG